MGQGEEPGNQLPGTPVETGPELTTPEGPESPEASESTEPPIAARTPVTWIPEGLLPPNRPGADAVDRWLTQTFNAHLSYCEERWGSGRGLEEYVVLLEGEGRGAVPRG